MLFLTINLKNLVYKTSHTSHLILISHRADTSVIGNTVTVNLADDAVVVPGYDNPAVAFETLQNHLHLLTESAYINPSAQLKL